MKSLLLVGLSLLVSSPAFAFLGFGDPPKPKPPKATIAVFHLAGAYPERDSDVSLFAEKKTFTRLLDRLRAAGKDGEVKAVVFRLGGLSLGLAKAEGLHNAILALRKAGKKTVAILESGMTADYLVAAACERLVMPPSGMLLLPGLRSEMLYFKGMMEKLGLVGDFLTVGDFKTAPEPFLRDSMSEAQRLQTTRLLDDLYAHLVSILAKSRSLKQEAVQAAIDKALLSPKDAKEARLIDDISYLPDLLASLQNDLKTFEVAISTKYAAKKAERPTSIFSLFSLFFQRPRASWQNDEPKIAVLHAEGNIYYGAPASSPFSAATDIWSDRMIQEIERISKLKNLRAVILRINSPGGSALASDLIWRRLEILKKKVPLYASMGSVAASGGYYIAMGADTILAQPSTITGSIGIFAGKLVMRETFKKVGITIESVSRGKNSALFSPFSAFTPSERAILQQNLNDTYKDFVGKAAQGRKMKPEELVKFAGGQVWTGRQALQNKLVDRLGDLQDTIALAQERTGLKVQPQVIHFPRPKSFFDALQEVSSSPSASPSPYAVLPGISAFFAFLSKLSPALASPLRLLFVQPHETIFLYQPLPQIRLR